jgi:hypothetical protein
VVDLGAAAALVHVAEEDREPVVQREGLHLHPPLRHRGDGLHLHGAALPHRPAQRVGQPGAVGARKRLPERARHQRVAPHAQQLPGAAVGVGDAPAGIHAEEGVRGPLQHGGQPAAAGLGLGAGGGVGLQAALAGLGGAGGGHVAQQPAQPHGLAPRAALDGHRAAHLAGAAGARAQAQVQRLGALALVDVDERGAEGAPVGRVHVHGQRLSAHGRLAHPQQLAGGAVGLADHRVQVGDQVRVGGEVKERQVAAVLLLHARLGGRNRVGLPAHLLLADAQLLQRRQQLLERLVQHRPRLGHGARAKLVHAAHGGVELVADLLLQGHGGGR